MEHKRAFEVRAGLVLYGGSSLAVYMGGVVQEFLQAVRAGQVTDLPYSPLLAELDAEFVVDVISGTSAGGINGAFLGRALATGGSLAHMGSLWRDLGDFASLVDWSRETDPPESLLNGRLFHRKLEEALAEVRGSRPLVDMLDLHLTATDLYGRYWQRQDFLGHDILGRQHTKYFRLKFRRDKKELGEPFSWLGYDGGQNDFASPEAKLDLQRIKRLAKLARTTAAFPAMFEPISWDPGDAYDDEPGVTADEREQIWLADGGILDNSPFGPTLKTIYERPATRPVDRLVFYVEPDPTDAAVPASARRNEKPSALNVAWSALDLRMYQGIDQYLRSIEEHNQVVRHVRLLVAKVTEQLNEESFGAEFGASPLRDAYLTLRRTQLAADVKQAVTRAYLAYRTRHPDLPTPDQALPWLDEVDWGRLCDTADVTYLRRHLHFLIEQTVLAEPAASGDAERLQALMRLKTVLWKVLRGLRYAQWRWWGTEINRLFEPGSTEQPERLQQALAQMVEECHPACWQEGLELQMTALGFTKQWRCFEAFDALLFPLSIGSRLGERDMINWVRISPYDADTLLRADQSDRSPLLPMLRQEYGRRKMAGDALFHFGGFLSPRWRANDYMWGRLDAADQIISSLVRAAEAASLGEDGALKPTPRYSMGDLSAIYAAAEQARLEAFRRILADELGEEGLEQLGAYTYARVAEATPPAGHSEPARALQEVAAAAAEVPVFPLPALVLAEPSGRASRMPWLRQLIRRYATWTDIRHYLLQDHQVGGESARSLHPAVLTNTAVDLAQNAGVVVGRIAAKNGLKLPAPVQKAAGWLGGLFSRFRRAVKLFFPRPGPGMDDRRPYWYLWVPGALAAFMLGLAIPLTRQVAVSVAGGGLVVLLLLLLRFLFPRQLAGLSRILPYAGIRTVMLVMLAALVSESPTLGRWVGGRALWGADLGLVLPAVRATLPATLFYLGVYDVMLLLSRLLTRSVQDLPAARAASLREQIRVQPPGAPMPPRQYHPPEGIMFDQQGRLVVTTIDGYVLRRRGRGWEQLGDKLHGAALAIAPDPLGGYLLAGSGKVWHWSEADRRWRALADVPSANGLVALSSGEVLVSSEWGCAVWRLVRNPDTPFAPARPQRLGWFFTPNGLAVDRLEETLYVACMVSGRVRAVDLRTGRRTTIANLGGFALLDGITVLPDGNLAVSTNWGDVFLVDPHLRKVKDRLRFPPALTPANLTVHEGEIWFAGLGRVIDVHGPRGEFVGSFTFH